MWTLDGIRIFPQEIDETTKQIIARLNPVGAGTIYHIFGWDNSVVKLTAKVVGQEDLDDLKDRTQTGVSYVLSGPTGIHGSYLISAVNSKRDNTIWQTIRQDLACDAPVFTVDLELFDDN